MYLFVWGPALRKGRKKREWAVPGRAQFETASNLKVWLVGGVVVRVGAWKAAS